MTETTATTGTSTNPVETDSADDSAIPEAGRPPAAYGVAAAPEPPPAGDAPASSAATLAGPAGEQTLPVPGATGHALGAGAHAPGAGGRTDWPGPADHPGSAPHRPAYTRPPGMPPPPDQLDANGAAATAPPVAGVPDSTPGVPASAVLSTASGSFPVVSAVAPVSAPPRATGRATAGGVTVRPIGAGTAVGAAPVTERMRPRPAATPRGPRRARLGVKRIDPWSVMKFSFAVSLVMFIVIVVAASVLYLALDTMGVFQSINTTIADLIDAGGGESGETFRITAQGVIGTSAVLGALNVLLFTSLATLSAFIYNVCADLVGGVEVTLAERD